MVALLIAAPFPTTFSTGVPELTSPGGSGEITSHSATIEVGRVGATLRSTTLVRNSGAKAGRFVVVLRRSSSAPGRAGSASFPLTATLDGRSLPLQARAGLRSEKLPSGPDLQNADLTASFPMSGRSTRALRVSAQLPLGRSAEDAAKRRIVYGGGSGSNGMDVAFKYGPGIVLGLPDIEPSAGWKIGSAGAYARLGNARSVVFEFYPGAFDGISGSGH